MGPLEKFDAIHVFVIVARVAVGRPGSFAREFVGLWWFGRMRECFGFVLSHQLAYHQRLAATEAVVDTAAVAGGTVGATWW